MLNTILIIQHITFAYKEINDFNVKKNIYIWKLIIGSEYKRKYLGLLLLKKILHIFM